MNIDYAQIIERANGRKEALEAFANRMKNVPEQAEKLRDVLVFFGHLSVDTKLLDSEAFALVKEAAEAALAFTARTNSLVDNLNSIAVYTDKPVYTRLVDIAKGQP